MSNTTFLTWILAFFFGLPLAAIAEVTCYADWRSTLFDTTEQADAKISGKLADPDGDGIPNLLEYALMLNPKSPDASGRPEILPDGISLAYNCRSDVADLSFTVETSPDLKTWSYGSNHTALSFLTPLDSHSERAVVQSLSTVGPRHFMRLRVTTPIWLRACHGSGGWNYLYAGVSLDGKSFTGIPPGILYGSWPSPGSQVRDPTVISYNGTWIVAYTGDSFGGVPWFGMAKSEDLVNWQQLPNVSPTGFSGTVNNIWAPEWFCENGRYFLVMRISTVAGNFYGPPGEGYMECLDPGTWKTWTTWQPLGGIPTDWNDACIVKSGTTYHLFANDGHGNIAHATSSQPFTAYGTGQTISSAWRATLGGEVNYVEGPNVVCVGGPRWRIYLQHGNTDICYYAESQDNMQTWSDITRLPWSGAGENPGHGTVIKLDIPSEQEIARRQLPLSPN
jgi:Glycosyl hydrolases family 43